MAGRFPSGQTSIPTNSKRLEKKWHFFQLSEVGLAYTKLTFHVQQCLFKQLGPTESVDNNDFCVCIIIDDETGLLCQGFPLAVDVVDEVDKCCRSICWSKWHDGIGPFDGIWALEGKFFLTS